LSRVAKQHHRYRYIEEVPDDLPAKINREVEVREAITSERDINSIQAFYMDLSLKMVVSMRDYNQ